MFKKIIAALVLGLASFVYAQQPQANDIPPTQPVFLINAEMVNGVAPGYWPTTPATTGLTLNVSKGTANCQGSIVTQGAQVLTMVNNAINRIYLDGNSSCVVAQSTSAFTSSQIPIAIVTTSGGNITVIQDVRTMMFLPSPGGAVIEINGVALHTPATANFTDGGGVAWTNPSGSTIIATVSASGSCGPLAGDTSSTNCGTGNNTGSTYTLLPAYINSFGFDNNQNSGGSTQINNEYSFGDNNNIGNNRTGAAYNFAYGTENNVMQVNGNSGFYEMVGIGNKNNYHVDGANTIVSIGQFNEVQTTGSGLQACNESNSVYIGYENNSNCSSQSSTNVIGIGYENVWNRLTNANAGVQDQSNMDVVFTVGAGNFLLNSATSTACCGYTQSNSDFDMFALANAGGTNLVNSGEIVAIGSQPIYANDWASVFDAIGIGDHVLNSVGNNAADLLAIGDEAMIGNSASGHYITGHDLIGIGNHADAAIESGTDDIAIGDYAGCVGYTASTHVGFCNVSGSHNVWIGDDASPGTATQLNNTVAIGYNATTTQSNEMVFGSSAMTLAIVWGDVEINGGTNIVYRCTSAGTLPSGALTIDSTVCGTSSDTGLRVQ